MKISILLKTILFGMFLIAPLNAQETDEMNNCHEPYSICTEKCEELEDGVEKCLLKCEAEYDKCSEKETPKDSD